MLKKYINKFVNSPHFFVVFALFILGLIFLFPQAAHADIISDFFSGVVETVAGLLVTIFLLVIQFLGFIFVILVSILISVAQFNEFINLSIVETGWSLARDVANMFFIVVLLIIAFSTILKISSYHYQKTLGKLIIMAVLINFSKLIAGFLIDFAQVVMLTFVNGFKDIAGGNFAEGFGMYKLLSLAQDSGQVGGDLLGGEYVAAAILGVIMILVADMIILIMIAVLLYRIAMLWVLVIISPLAYLSYSFMPKYWSQWWQMFFQHLVSGPVIAFFLWLALLAVQTGTIQDSFQYSDTGELRNEEQIFPTDINEADILNYMVMIALLIGGLTISQKVAQQSGGAVGNFASKVTKGGQALAGMPLKAGKSFYDWSARKTGKLTKGRSDILLRPIRTIKKFREGQKHLAELENQEIEAEAGKILEGGGAQGLVFGAASRDFAYNMQGFLGMKGMYGIVKGKAQTARSIAEQKESKLKEQQEHMEMVNMKDRDEKYVGDLKNQKDQATSEKENYAELLKAHEKKVTDPRKQAKQLSVDIKKRKDELKKLGYDESEIDADLEIADKEEEKNNLLKDAEKLEKSQDWQEERKRLAVHALGFDEAEDQGYIDSDEIVKEQDGSQITMRNAAYYEDLEKQRIYDSQKELYDKAKKGDKGAKNRLEGNAKEYYEAEYNKKKAKRDALANGALNETDKEEKKSKIFANEDRIKQIEKDKANTTDQTQIDKLNEIIKAIKDENDGLQAKITATSPEQIKKSFKANEIEQNKKNNTDIIESLDSDLKELDFYKNNAGVSGVERENHRQEAQKIGDDIKTLDERLKKINSYIPQAYYSRQAGRSAMREEESKIETSNEDELVSLFNNAMRTKNISKAAAVTMAATKVGHLNEIVQSQKASKDVYIDLPDGTKKLIAKKGNTFSSGVEGLHAFTKDVLQGKLGMSEQVAMGYENDFSDTAQDVNHWTFAQAMTVENGRFVQRSRHDQQTAVAIEKSKQDFENLMRRSNRLGWMTEKYIDPTDPTSGRTAILNAEGIDAIKSNFKAIEGLIGKQRFNVNLATNLSTSLNLKILDEIGRSLPSQEKKDWANFVQSLLGYVNKTRKDAERTMSPGSVQYSRIGEADKLRKKAGVSLN